MKPAKIGGCAQKIGDIIRESVHIEKMGKIVSSVIALSPGISDATADSANTSSPLNTPAIFEPVTP